MLFYTVGQSYAFLAMLGCGLILGAWYDLMRLSRRLLEAGPWLTAFMDAIFAVGALAIVVFSLMRVSRLEVRLYALVGAGAGTALYLWGVSPILTKIIRTISKIFSCFRRNAKMKNFFHFFVK